MSNHQILNSADHGGLRVHTGAGAQFGDNVMACLTVPPEFRQVQAHFPIVFRRDIESGKLSALVLFGFENGDNLFLQGGQWDAGYRPLTMAIQPFLIGRAASGDDMVQVHVDMAHARISKDGEGTRLFDDQGQPTPYLEGIAGKLAALDQSYRDSAAFFDVLERYELIEPFTLEVTLADGTQQSLVGFQTIAEQRLAALDADVLHMLLKQGHLTPIYMALASLAQLPGLVTRKNARVSGG